MNLDTMSSEDLYRLYKEKTAMEKAQRLEESKQEIADIKHSIRMLDADYKANRLELENKLAHLLGRATAKRKKRTSGISSRVLEIIRERNEVSAKEILAVLVSEGMRPKNLHQSLVYLKGKGQIESAGTGRYKAAA